MLLPPPPIDMVVDKTAELYITAFLATITLGSLVFALHHWWRTGRPVVLMLVLAGGSMMVFEPMVDTVGACWFAANSWIAFEAYGRPIPVWLCLAYFFYFGIASATVWMSLRKGMTGGQIHFAFITAMIGDLIFESVLLMYDPYAYYGNQPLKPTDFALWWMPVNGLIPIALGAIVYKFDSYFHGWRAILIIPIGLTTSAAVNATIGWPSWLVINTPMPWAITQLGGIMTFVLAFAIVRFICYCVATDAPGRRNATLATA